MRHKTRVSAFTTSIQQVFEVLATVIGQGRNKKHPKKEELKLSLFAVDRKPYRLHPKLLDLINEFRKVAGYKVKIQKFKVFLYTNNELSECEIKKKSHLYSNKNNKVPRNKPYQGGKSPVIGKLHNIEGRN